MTEPRYQGVPARRASSTSLAGHEPANLGDILERVLDRGIIIAGDIRVNLLDIELLTIKLRLIIASVDTAREMGIDWWEHDPWLTGDSRRLVEENRRLRERLAEVEEAHPARRPIEGRVEPDERPARRREPLRREPERREPERREPELEEDDEYGG
ncbi:Gas vesicle protein [Sinosporangium album]|uniref:Gas vesicle protein n=1 Tax=Sinosporangium album TaxID=504805 RepID=A0A1G8C6M8_9ACTN|nr:gas vesicle protein [Sinosporangium album]SDH41012.1 Gas vesicle protein [Sinosporangium album]